MLKKVTGDIKAAVVLIVTENIAALRMFIRNLTNSIFKSAPKQQNTKRQDKQKETVTQKETKNVEENNYIEHCNSGCVDRS
ncbi:MAG: hypothetical protein HQ580_10180 [Planctomycetes bacterium]|nr:hypothetical protein [Planctomycetota bacterium]